MGCAGVVLIFLAAGWAMGSFTWEVRLWITIASAIISAYGWWNSEFGDSEHELLFPLGATVTVIFFFSLYAP